MSSMMPAPSLLCGLRKHPGGKDNFEPDRIAAEKVLALVPGLRRAAVENRRFLRRVVRFLAAEAGISSALCAGAREPVAAGNLNRRRAAFQPQPRRGPDACPI